MARPVEEGGSEPAVGHAAGPPMTAATWISDEGQVVAIARRALERGWRRPRRVFAVAALAAVAFVGIRLYRPPAYEARLHFHLAEGDVTDPTHAPRPPSAVREYVFNVALSRDRVERVMKKHRWSTRYLARDRVAAIDEFREDVNVEVERNYFVYERRPSDPPRSAVVTVSLVGADPDQTVATLRDIGDTIEEEQRTQRVERLANVRRLLEVEMGRAQERSRHLQASIARMQLEARRARGADAIDLRTRIAALQVEAKAALDEQLVLERRAGDVAFTEAAEGENLGLRLERVDESLVALTRRLSPLQLARGALAVFAVVALLAVPVLGAFDDRVYGPEDLAARGLPLLGGLERFRDDDGGSYRRRPHAKGV
jgi:hypothetical protein